MTEIRPRNGRFTWIRVLPKEVECGEERLEMGGLGQEVYLALNRSRNGLFVSGAFWTKEEAWEGCRKYITQLLYCEKETKNSELVDEGQMRHAKGIIGGLSHHWFVGAYRVDENV